MKTNLLSAAAALCAVVMPALSASAQTTGEITCRFNPAKVILPSSQYTPNEPYEADVWVINEGRRYNGELYNFVFGIPEPDMEDRDWYDPAYELTDGLYEWQVATAPFSSDEYYKDHKSFRWVEAEIMGEIYMRRTFTLESLPAGAIYLACGHDDGPSEWYINGVKVHSITDGWNNGEYILLTDDQKALLKVGQPNVIAVHVHQNWGGAFADCGLYEADMELTTHLLPTKEKGTWPAKYYLLNYTADLAQAEAANWASLEEDESDWINGVGPFSSEHDTFLGTDWPSFVRPMLVRRHFNLSATDLATAQSTGRVVIGCSYDENPVMYLNGTRIWSASGWNDNNYAEITLNEAQRALLREGDNVLAVSLTDGGGSGHIDYGIKLVTPYDPSGILLPTADKATLSADTRIFNLHGQYMGTSTEGLPRGIYVRGGQKLVLGQ